MKYQRRLKYFHSRKGVWKCRLQNVGHFVSASMLWKTWWTSVLAGVWPKNIGLVRVSARIHGLSHCWIFFIAKALRSWTKLSENHFPLHFLEWKYHRCSIGMIETARFNYIDPCLLQRLNDFPYTKVFQSGVLVTEQSYSWAERKSLHIHHFSPSSNGAWKIKDDI